MGRNATRANGVIATSTNASTTTTSSTTGQAPGVHEPQATYLRQLSRSSTHRRLIKVSGEDAKYCPML
jgi:hypothetical protein